MNYQTNRYSTVKKIPRNSGNQNEEEWRHWRQITIWWIYPPPFLMGIDDDQKNPRDSDDDDGDDGDDVSLKS